MKKIEKHFGQIDYVFCIYSLIAIEWLCLMALAKGYIDPKYVIYISTAILLAIATCVIVHIVRIK